MTRKSYRAMIVIILISFLFPQPTKAETIPEYCIQGTHAAGAEYLICVPENWNGTLIVYAHGYVAFNEPVGIPWDQLIFPDGTSIPEIMTSLGFAFATTSYSENGLAVQVGLNEIVDLVTLFESLYPIPNLVLLGGVSEGGLITALAIEQYPDVFDGGLSACGPVGNFNDQINYWGDFRVVYDVLFPDLLPPGPMDIPQEVIENWDNLYLPEILTAVKSNPLKTAQLLSITRAPFDQEDLSTIQQTVEHLLWYNVFATNDGVEKLGGQPFDNQDRVYSGVVNRWYFNQKVERFAAEQIALDEIEANYQTSGVFSVPLVTLHTTGDEVVPYWHQTLYKEKINNYGSPSLYFHIPVFRYGHCNFEVYEVLAGFAALLLKVSGQPIESVDSVLPDETSYNAYLSILQSLNNLP